MLKEFIRFWKEHKKQQRDIKKAKQLCKAPFDYDYLQALVNSVAVGNDVEIDIKMNDGHIIVIKKERKNLVKADPYLIG